MVNRVDTGWCGSSCPFGRAVHATRFRSFRSRIEAWRERRALLAPLAHNRQALKGSEPVQTRELLCAQHDVNVCSIYQILGFIFILTLRFMRRKRKKLIVWGENVDVLTSLARCLLRAQK